MSLTNEDRALLLPMLDKLEASPAVSVVSHGQSEAGVICGIPPEAETAA